MRQGFAFAGTPRTRIHGIAALSGLGAVPFAPSPGVLPFQPLPLCVRGVVQRALCCV